MNIEPRDFSYRPWQPHMHDHVFNNPRCALFAGMGLGKTLVTETAIDTVSLCEPDPYPMLVIGTLRVARKVWSTESAKWNHLRHLKVGVVLGSADLRRKVLRGPKCDIYTINYENLVWLAEELGDDWPFKTVVADECTKLRGFRTQQGTKRAAALKHVAHTKVRRWVNLTGLAAPSGLKNLWGQMWFLDGGTRLGLTYTAFENRWFAYQRIEDALNHSYKIVPIILPAADREIHAKIRDLCLAVDAKDWFDVKDPIVTPVPIELPEAARRHYKEMERKFYTEILGHGIEAVHAAAKSIKCLQLASGAVYLDPEVEDDGHVKAREFIEVHDRKIEALEDIIEEANGMPVIVAYQFKSDLVRLQKAFPKGRVLATERDEDDFKAGRIELLFAHPASAGHGIDGFQDVTNIMVFFSHWWDLELREQIIGRIGPVRQMQSGHDRPVFIYDIVAEGTVDQLVLQRHKTKMSVQELLMEDMKAKGFIR
jgi:SNF2 family DNA or RNA helicase